MSARAGRPVRATAGSERRRTFMKALAGVRREAAR
jgi:hypothetical protein